MSEKAKKSGFHYAYLMVAAGLIITAVPCAMVLSCAGIYFTPVSQYFGVAKADFTLYFSILNVAMMVGLPIGGKLMSKLDLRIVLSVCVAICGAGCILTSMFNALWQFYIAGAIMGLAVAPLVYLAVPTLVNAWCVKNVGFFIGNGMVGTGLGAVVFNPIGTAFINMGAEGWRTGYLVFGAIILIVTLPVTLLLVRSNPADKGLKPYGFDEQSTEGDAPTAPLSGVPASQAMKSVAFICLAAFAFIITLNQTVYQFIPSYCASFADSMPDIAASAGIVAAACMAGQALGKVVLGAVNDKDVRFGMVVGLGLGAIGIVVMWFLPAQLAALMAGAFLFGFAYACTTVQTTCLTREAFGSLDYTNIYSRVSMFGALAGALAAWLLGIICDLPNGFSIMFIFSLAMMAACFLFGLIALGVGRKIERVDEKGNPVSGK